MKEGTKKKSLNKYWRVKQRVNSWSFNTIQDMIKYKGDEAGIPVIICYTKTSSLTCNKCNNFDKLNRNFKIILNKKGGIIKKMNRARFQCTKCGYDADADFNASVNIARTFYDHLKEKTLYKNNNKWGWKNADKNN